MIRELGSLVGRAADLLESRIMFMTYEAVVARADTPSASDRNANPWATTDAMLKSMLESLPVELTPDAASVPRKEVKS